MLNALPDGARVPIRYRLPYAQHQEFVKVITIERTWFASDRCGADYTHTHIHKYTLFASERCGRHRHLDALDSHTHTRDSASHPSGGGRRGTESSRAHSIAFERIRAHGAAAVAGTTCAS